MASNDGKIRDLTQKLIEKNLEINELKQKHDQELLNVKKELIQIKKQKIVLSNDGKYKEALKLYAYGYSNSLIHKILTTEMGIDITVEEITYLTGKVETLGTELYMHYQNCVKDFKEQGLMDSAYFRLLMMKRFNLLESDMQESLHNAKLLQDETLQVKVRDQLSNLYDKMSKAFAKNMEDVSQDNTVDEIMDGYDDSQEESDKIIEFSSNGMKVI